jgi:hypothetical protein
LKAFNLGVHGTWRRFVLLFVVVILALSGLSPVLRGHANAYGQITDRSLTLSSAVPSASGVTYTFKFTPLATGQVQGLKFIACTTAIGTYPGGTCTAPTGMTAGGDGFSSAAFASQSGWDGATNFATDLTGANDCTASANVLCAKRTDATPESTVISRTIAFNSIKNPSVANTAFYVGIYTYTTNNWVAPEVDFGATASAVVQTLSTSAAVAEVLQFCVGSTTVDDTATLIASDCSGVSGTSLNIGTLDTSTINISPYATNGGDNKNGVAMMRTNALNGSTISYDAIQQSGTNHLGTLRIGGATCSASSGPGTGSPPAASGPYTDPCIDAAGATQNSFTAGTEEFGMTVAGVNYGSTTSYSCTYGDTTALIPVSAGNSCSLHPSTNYLGNGTSGSTEDYGTANGFAWVDDGTATQIASSSTAIDDEALILKFAATPSITTPFGTYVAQSDYIAVPTY